jgi:hypothetical protein
VLKCVLDLILEVSGSHAFKFLLERLAIKRVANLRKDATSVAKEPEMSRQKFLMNTCPQSHRQQCSRSCMWASSAKGIIMSYAGPFLDFLGRLACFEKDAYTEGAKGLACLSFAICISYTKQYVPRMCLMYGLNTCAIEWQHRIVTSPRSLCQFQYT